jgi:hypothetical protein
MRVLLGVRGGYEQLDVVLVAVLTLLQVWVKMSLITPPRAKMTTTMTAAIAARSRPYSTAEAPSSVRKERCSCRVDMRPPFVAVPVMSSSSSRTDGRASVTRLNNSGRSDD